MRIAVVHSFYESSQPSGENSVVRDQVQALRDAGHDVELVARETDVAQAERLYTLRSALTVMTGHGPDPTPRIAAFRPDVVHVHNTFPNWGTSRLSAWSARTVVTTHNFRPLCAAATLFRDGAACTDCLRTPVLPAIAHACYRRSRVATLPLAVGTRPGGPALAILRRAAAVTVLNEQARELFGRVLGREVHLIPNFVDAVRRCSEEPRHGWVYVGRFTPEKGIVELVQDWPAGEHLDVLGAGPLNADVRAGASVTDVQVLQPLDRDKLRERLGRYEGLILPSLWAEGLPTVALEALAAGTPVVVSTAIASGPALRDLGVAELYDPALGTGEIVRALTAVRARGETMTKRAYEVHGTTYSAKAWLSTITAVYERVANGAARD